MLPALAVIDLGTAPYRAVWQLQLALVAARQADAIADTLLLVEHPHVITLGRAQKAAANVLAADDVEVVAIERGGDVTYHGPGQLVAYPIVKLGPTEQDLHGFLRNLEHAVMFTCEAFGLAVGREPGKTGVWIGGAALAEDALALPADGVKPVPSGARKLCSMGIACRRWVTFHGLALNVSTDLAYFARINPCGFAASVMTSMAAELRTRGADAARLAPERITPLSTQLNGGAVAPRAHDARAHVATRGLAPAVTATLSMANVKVSLAHALGETLGREVLLDARLPTAVVAQLPADVGAQLALVQGDASPGGAHVLGASPVNAGAEQRP